MPRPVETAIASFLILRVNARACVRRRVRDTESVSMESGVAWRGVESVARGGAEWREVAQSGAAQSGVVRSVVASCGMPWRGFIRTQIRW